MGIDEKDRIQIYDILPINNSRLPNRLLFFVIFGNATDFIGYEYIGLASAWGYSFWIQSKYSTVHKLIYEENGPPVMIKLSTLTVLPQNETRTIRCEVAGAQYFLWNFPNGDFLQTTVPTVSPRPYQIRMLIFPPWDSTCLSDWLKNNRIRINPWARVFSIIEFLLD